MTIETMPAPKTQVSYKTYSLVPNPAYIGATDVILMRLQAPKSTDARAKAKAKGKPAPTIEDMKKRFREKGILFVGDPQEAEDKKPLVSKAKGKMKHMYM